MVKVTPKEQIELCSAVEALFDDPDICLSTTDICDDHDGYTDYTALCIETKGWNRKVLVRINEMYRDVRLGIYTLMDIAREIVIIHSMAYHHRTTGTFVTIGN